MRLFAPPTRRARRPTPTIDLGGDSNWETLRSAPGVVRYFNLDSSDANLSGRHGDRVGINPAETFYPINCPDCYHDPETDFLRFDQPSQAAGAGVSGWWGNASDGDSRLFSEGDEFFVRMQVWMNHSAVHTKFTTPGGGDQGGIKWFDIVSGDHGGTVYPTNTANKLVIQTYYQSRVLQIYHAAGINEGLYHYTGDDQYLLFQSERSTCDFQTVASGYPPHTWGNCVPWVEENWMTVQVGVTLGAKNVEETMWEGARVRMWLGYQGLPQVLVHDWSAANGDRGSLHGAWEPYGKVWVFPYMTGHTGEDQLPHDTASFIFRHLIISENFVEDGAA